MSKSIIAYHFTDDALRDGRTIPPIGEWLRFYGKVKMCQSGLHASRDPFDALQYAPGPLLHKVECDEIVDEQNDKLVCRARKIIATVDMTDPCRYFARMQALSVVHLWDAPDVVLDFLWTGDERLRDAARAARAAAWAAWAARDAARAARAAAWAAGAAGDAAWAARDAAWAARDAAADAAWGNAISGARGAVCMASRAAGLPARRRRGPSAGADFNQLVDEAFEIGEYND